MITITKEQAELLAKRGIEYQVGHMWHPENHDGKMIAVVDEYNTSDEKDKEPLDIHLDRLRPSCGGEYLAALKGLTIKVQNALPSHTDVIPDWTIEDDGSLVNKEHSYVISADQILEQKDWILHMMWKPWVNLNSFIPAYFLALERLGIKNAEIVTHYE